MSHFKVSHDGENEFSLTRNDLLGQKIQDDEYESDVTWSDLPGHKVDYDEPHDLLLADGWSQLRYVDVAVEGLPDNVTALNDSGCQLCVVRSEVVKPLALPKLGHAKLKGLSLEVVPADLVRIKIKMHEGTEFLTITCAVVENLNYQLILGSDIVDKLNRQLINDTNGSAELMAVDISDDVLICDEDANDVVSNCDIDGCDDANPDDVIGDKNHQITGISADNDDFDHKNSEKRAED